MTASTSSPKQQQPEACEDEERRGRLERGDDGDSNNNPPAPFRDEEEEVEDDDDNSTDEDIDDHDDKDNAVPPPPGTVPAAEEQHPPAALSASHREVDADREVLVDAAAAAVARTAPIEREEATVAATMPGGIDGDETILPAPPPTTIPSSSSSSLATGNGLVVVVAAVAAAAATTTTMSTGSMIEGLSREELERRFLSMEGQVQSMEGKVQSMEDELRAVTGENQKNQQSQSLRSQLIAAGLLGIAPPLFVDIDAVLRWAGWASHGCFGGPNGSGDDGPAGGNPPPIPNDCKGLLKAFLHRIGNYLRLPFYVFVSLLDFTDAIVDATVSVRALLDDSSEVDNDRVVKGWALVLFFGTVLARLLGGLFGVVYHRIDDKTDREFSYFLVEMIILGLEDFASIVYLVVKSEKGGEPNRLELVSFCLTTICFLFFFIPLTVHKKRLRNRVPPYADEVRLLIMISAAFAILGTKKGLVAGSISDTLFRVLYPLVNILMLVGLFWWFRSLYRRDQPRTTDARRFEWSRSLYERYRSGITTETSQTHEFPDTSVPAGDDLAS